MDRASGYPSSMDNDRYESRFRRGRYRSPAAGVILGGIVVAIGLLLLLGNMHIIRIRDLWEYWPLILVAFGIARIVESRTPSSTVSGGLVAIVGALLFLDSLNLFVFDFRVLWPVVVIAFGVSMLWRAVDRNRFAVGSSSSTDPSFSYIAIFSGGKRRIDSGEFHGGDVLAIFGGYTLDLRGASMQGDQAVVDINAMFGGVEIKVPETWTVVVKAMGIFGGIDDKTIPPAPSAPAHRLVLTGVTLFGGCSIRN